MNKHRPLAMRLLSLVAALGCASSLSAAVTIIDDFNYTSFSSDQSYWTRPASSGDQAFTSGGKAVLRAREDAPAYSVIVSPTSDTRYNFFETGFTVGVTDLTLTSANLALNDAYFRFSLVSSANRQYVGDDAITMRVRYNADGLGGLVLFGYKMNQTNVDAEIRTGTSTTSLESFNFSGTINSTSLSFEPLALNGSVATIGYTISFITSEQTYTRSGTMDIDKSAWGDGSGVVSLALEARRNNNTTALANSDAQVTIGAVTYETISNIPEPSAFAALAGLGVLGLAATRRRRQG